LNAAKLLYSMVLRRFSRELVVQMVEALLGDTVSDQFVDSICRATEGNPLFIEEVIKGLATDGQIILRDGRWEQRDTSQLLVPGSIKSVLGQRMDRVKKPTLELLQLAAVIGRNFSLDVLSAAGHYDEDTIQWAIEEALRYELIEVSRIVDQPAASNGQLNIYYQFQHALIRETLYGDLRPLRRRRWHRKVAAAMEKLAANGSLDLAPAVLAHHYVAAARDEKAVPYLRQAGEAACQVYAHAEAVDYLEQAFEILEDIAPDLNDEMLLANLGEQYALLDQIRRFVGLSGDRSRELTILEKMQTVAEAMNDRQRWVEVMSRLATYYWQVGQLGQAEEIARRALEVARQDNDRRGEQYCLEQIARVYWTRRDAESMEYATQALVIAQELGDRRREGRLIELVGNIYTDTLNDAERAAIYLEQALEICRETGNRLEEAWTLWSMGGLSMMIDDFTRALERYGQAKKISEDLGASLQVGWDLYRMGDAWYNLGRQEEAQSHYEQAQVIFNASQHLRGKIYTIISLGLVFMTGSQMEEAATYLEQAMRQAEDRQDLTLMFRSYQALAVYYRLLGGEENLVEAVRLSNRIIKLASEAGHFEPELLGYYLRGAGFFDMGDPSEAFKSSSLAVQQLEQLTFLQSPQIAETEILYRHSQIAAALGQPDAARNYWQKAYAETMRKAELILDDQLRRHFLEQIPLNREIVHAGQAG
jgi:tetratricopeptide (TPR) repeat protein